MGAAVLWPGKECGAVSQHFCNGPVLSLRWQPFSVHLGLHKILIQFFLDLGPRPPANLHTAKAPSRELENTSPRTGCALFSKSIATRRDYRRVFGTTTLILVLRHCDVQDFFPFPLGNRTVGDGSFFQVARLRFVTNRGYRRSRNAFKSAPLVKKTRGLFLGFAAERWFVSAEMEHHPHFQLVGANPRTDRRYALNFKLSCVLRRVNEAWHHPENWWAPSQ